MSSSETIAKASSFCQSIVNLDSSILVATVIHKGKSLGTFARQGTPQPNKDAAEVKLIQTELAAAIIRENENYLGRVKYIHVCQEMADMIVFPKDKFLLFIIAARPYDLEGIVSRVSGSLSELAL